MHSFKLLSSLVLLTLAQMVGIAASQDANVTTNDKKLADLESEISYRLIGGSPVAEGAWPWQVALYMRDATGIYNMRCGGSIINENWVLTAAHCIDSRDPGKYKIVEGTNEIDRPLKAKGGRGHVIAVQQVTPHEGYDASKIQNDVALIRLASHATSSAVLLALPETDAPENPGQLATITGWGLIRPMDRNWKDFATSEQVKPWDSRYFPGRLLEASLPLIDCKQAPENWQQNMDHRNVCAFEGDGGKASCQGDSGGPLVARDANGQFEQIGVVSFGGTNCAKNPSVFSRVSAFETWIEGTSGLKLSRPAEPPVDQPKPPPRPPGPPPTPPGPISDVDNPAGVVVSIVQGDSLKIDQNAQFKVTTAKPGYLVLVDITPDGKLTQIFPNARSLSTPTGGRTKSNYVEANRGLLVPDPKNPYDGLEFKTEPPYGEGVLVAILSAEPLKSVSLPELPKAMERNEALDFLAGLTTELRQNLEINGVTQPRDWSLAKKTYQIIK
jgi:secreted trypsin-like serine protease